VAIVLHVGDEDSVEKNSKVLKVILLHFGKEAIKLACINFTKEHVVLFWIKYPHINSAILFLDKVP